MKKYIIHIICLLAVAMLVTGCKDESFTIEGSLKDGGTQNIRALYVTDYESLQSDWVTMANGQFELTGINYDWTVVYLINNKKDIIARAAVKNGDKIKVEGSMSDPLHIEVTGNDANEQWNAFMRENAALYASPDKAPLNSAIEKYVDAYPDRISSTLLLLNDYTNLNNTTDVDSLFKRLSIDARPAGLVNNYFALSQQLDREKSSSNIPSLMLYNSEDTITTIIMARHKATLMYFWDKRDTTRGKEIDCLKQLYGKYSESGRLQVADIMLSADSSGWQKVLAADSTQWKHYWAPGGPLNRNLLNIGIDGTPYCIVTTSVGKQLYRGKSVEEAVGAADKYMQSK